MSATAQARANVDDVSKRDEARDSTWPEATARGGAWERTQMCCGAWKVRGARDQRNRAFERHMGACVVSDNVEAFMIV